MARLIKYPVGIQSFSELITGGYVYVDKTMYVRKMIDSGKYYFLSRPRRFGKSLFLTTLQAYFEGQRDLFKGFALDTDEVDWVPKPVIKFSFNAIRTDKKENLDNYLDVTLSDYEAKYNIKSKGDFTDRFAKILRVAKEKIGQKAAILVDEYDALLLETLRSEQSELNAYYRQTLKSLFSILKNEDQNICFVFITGISRFSHTSLFSGANHLEDISIQNEYGAICGITEDELKDNFKEGIEALAAEEDVEFHDMLAELKENYDGYHFSKNCPDLYNPFSILRTLKSKEIDNYWFQAGTPSYLIEILKRDDFFMPSLDCLETVESTLTAKESYLNNPVSLLFESGFVTIKSYSKERKSFQLGLPNSEVATAFTHAIIPIYCGIREDVTNAIFLKLRNSIIDGEPQQFMEELKTFLHGNPYGLSELDKREKYFQSSLYLMLRALGFEPHAELQTCNARMDMMIQTSRYVYIFELKTNGSAQEAMDQIEAKGYHIPFLNSGKQIIKIAANYSSAVNNLDNWIIERIDN